MRVSIFGCGWLGRALAKRLRPKHVVFGAVRSEGSMVQLRKENITAFQNPAPLSPFWDAEVLVVSISPRDAYLETLAQLPHIVGPSVVQVILLSSTSVYGDIGGIIDETSPIQSESIVARGEAQFKRDFPKGVIIRLGGLMGDDRIAGQWASKTLEDTPVNYIHQADAVGVIEQVIEQKVQNETINAVAPVHPKRSMVYKKNAELFGFELPQFKEGKEKVVSGEKSRRLLLYTYRFDDPRRFWPDTRGRSR